jgi:pimeloyl-ACP methyl ester carboxylesterase
MPARSIFNAIQTRMMRRMKFYWTPILLLILFGCGGAIGTRDVGFRKAYEQINSNAFLDESYSTTSKNVLQRYNMGQFFKEDPLKCLNELHQKIKTDNRRDLLFALAELNYFTAKYTLRDLDDSPLPENMEYYLDAAIYAYFYLFDETRNKPANPYDRRYRLACDLYNIALAEAMTDTKGNLSLKTGVRKLPLGDIHLTLDTENFPIRMDRFEKIVAADRLDIYGLSKRNRDAGLGVAFIAVTKKTADLPIKRTSPGTLFMRIDGSITNLEKGSIKGKLELFAPFDRTHVEIHGKPVPLESDLSAQLAYNLNQPELWKLDITGFFMGKSPIPTGLYFTKPFNPRQIPVVFVHGTASSPVWWAEMANTLASDPILRKSCQFWFYFYDSGKAIGLSAHEFRETLTREVAELDPKGLNRSLHNMVIIGHSQGGLLTKLTATDTGEKIIRKVTGKGLKELDLTPEQRKLIAERAVFESLPFVKRVIFISTPHRGSFLAGDWVRELVRRLVFLPVDIVKQTVILGKALASAKVPEEWRISENRTSIDSMSPKNPSLLALSEIPLAPGVKGHSIISVQGEGELTELDDGVVEYKSAHVGYVDSEFIVRSGHSCQGHPLTIEEVRRILLLHLNSAKCTNSVTPRQADN